MKVNTRPLWNRSNIVVYTAVIVFASLFVGLAFSKPSAALSPSSFNPGRIIDDAVFYNSSSMTAQEIQTFLDEKMPNCDTNGTQSLTYHYNPNTKYVSYSTYSGDPYRTTTTRAVFGERAYQYRMQQGLPDNGSRAPYKCLKNYTMDVPQQPAASSLCSQIDAMTNATAAQIIKAVADACGINPQVILVILEKEQSLVQGDNWPFGTRYSHAMGYGCPDTAACDVNYEGLFKQIYHGAKQYQIYKNNPNVYNYRAGKNNIILFNEDHSCGSSTVFIENQATAGLYIYTPYQPNQATINWKLGSGPSVSSAHPGCGAFGNINFFMLFSKWFGSTRLVNYTPMEEVRWMEMKNATTKIDLATGEPVGEVLNEKRQLKFIDKTLRDGIWYLRTAYDYSAKSDYGVALSDLSNIDYEPITPEWKIINYDGVHRYVPHAEKWLIKDGSLPIGTALRVTSKITVNGATSYRTEYNNDRNQNIAFQEERLDDLDYILPLDTPRIMNVLKNTNMTKLNGNSCAVVPQYRPLDIKGKFIFNGVLYFAEPQAEINPDELCFIRADNLNWSPIKFVPFEEPRDMKLSKNVARINLETGSTFDTLQKDRVIHFSSKIMYKNQWYYRTTHNTGTNSPFGIPASSVGEAN